jgi:large subunit ribosomal protein L4
VRLRARAARGNRFGPQSFKENKSEMSKVPIIDLHGNKTGDYEVAEEWLVLNRGSQAVHDVVVAHQAAQRAGTASTLNKGLVSGSNIKPWRQKGLGRARAGYRQSPVWRGGGVVFGPKPRSYAKQVTKKVKALAFARALSGKISDGSLRVLNELSLAEGKAKIMAGLLRDLKAQGRTLFVIAQPDENLMRATRNMKNTAVSLASGVNVYQLLLYRNLLVTSAAMAGLLERLRGIANVAKS